MIVRLTILFLIVIVVNAWAQEERKRIPPTDVGTISLKENLPFSDSIPMLKDKRLDSLEQVKRKLKGISTTRMDSIRKELSTPEVGDLWQRAPDIPVVSSMDTLGFNKVDGTQEKIQGRIDEARKQIVDKIGEPHSNMSDELSDDATFPKLDKILPGSESLTEVPGNTNLNQLPDFPNASLPSTSNVSIPSPQGVDTPSVPKVDNLDEIDERIGERMADVNEKANGVREVEASGDATIAKAQEVQKDIKDVQQNGVDGATQNAEKNLEKIVAVKEVKRKVAPATQKQAEYEAMLKKYQDKKTAKQELERKLGNVVNNQINQFTPSIKSSIGDLEKNKKRFNDARQMSDSIKHKKLNLMSGKPLGRRLIPGIAFQVLKRSVYSIDLGAQIGYRVTQNITAGIGGAHRFGINKGFDHYIQSLQVTSARIYGDLMLKKGWFPHGELEFVTTPKSVLNEQVKEPNVLQTNIGIGKSYKLSKRLKGYALLLYRIEWHGELIEQSKLNLRVGFNFDTKSRKTKVVNNVIIKL